MAKILATAASDPVYASHLPTLKAQLGMPALGARIIKILEGTTLPWLSVEQGRAQQILAGLAAQLSAMPEEHAPLLDVMTAARSKVYALVCSTPMPMYHQQAWVVHMSIPLWATPALCSPFRTSIAFSAVRCACRWTSPRCCSQSQSSCPCFPCRLSFRPQAQGSEETA